MKNTLIVYKLAKAVVSPFGPKRPRTPIRWLCLKSFSYLGEVQDRRIVQKRFDALNRALELGVYLNRCFDRKRLFRISEYRELRRQLPEKPTRTYLSRLKALEQNRPQVGDWDSVLDYRRSVLDVSLNYLFDLSRLNRRTVLLPLVSLVQLADDVLDRRVDQELGLPTFVSTDGPHPQLLADEFWAEIRTHRAPEDRPFLMAGWVVYLFTRALILCAG